MATSTASRDLSKLSDKELDDLRDSYRRQRSALTPQLDDFPTEAPAPVVGRRGPDPHVLAGRADRALNRERLAASVSGASARMSEADIEKLRTENAGKGLVASTPNIDAFKRRNNISGPPITSANLGGMQAAVADAADAFRRSKAMPSKKPAPSVSDRVKDITSTLQPGEHVMVKQGDELTAGRSVAPGNAEVVSIKATPGMRFSAGPGRVKNDLGEWVPIGEETERIAKPFNDALTARDRATTETAAVIQKNQDENPAIKASRALAQFKKEQSARYAGASDPFRRQPRRAPRPVNLALR